jgi:hypothetical protein
VRLRQGRRTDPEGGSGANGKGSEAKTEVEASIEEISCDHQKPAIRPAITGPERSVATEGIQQNSGGQSHERLYDKRCRRVDDITARISASAEPKPAASAPQPGREERREQNDGISACMYPPVGVANLITIVETQQSAANRREKISFLIFVSCMILTLLHFMIHSRRREADTQQNEESQQHAGIIPDIFDTRSRRNTDKRGAAGYQSEFGY